MEFCRTCPDRLTCKEICPLLEAHLKTVSTYQRDKLLSERALTFFADHSLFKLEDYYADRNDLYDRIIPYLIFLLPGDRELFILRFFEGLSEDEIAAATGLKKWKVRYDLDRARRHLTRFVRSDPANVE